MAITFDKKLERLEEIVKILESGDVNLAEVNKLFSEGVDLAKSCLAELNDSKGKITILQQEIGELVEKPFVE